MALPCHLPPARRADALRGLMLAYKTALASYQVLTTRLNAHRLIRGRVSHKVAAATGRAESSYQSFHNVHGSATTTDLSHIYTRNIDAICDPTLSQ